MAIEFNYKKFLLVVLIGGTSSLVSACETTHSSNAVLTVEETLARAQSLDGTQVSVFGYLVLDFEDHNLYASRRDAVQKVNNQGRCIALTLTEEMYARWKGKDMSLVFVSGTLNKDYCGPDEFCPSACNRIAIENVKISQ